MKKIKLEIIVFLCGAIVMSYEILGSRILAPVVGTSIYVWTSLIGIILGSLSLGYWWGGRKSDKEPSYEYLAKTIFYAGISIGILGFSRQYIFSLFINDPFPLNINSLFISLILFATPAFFLGIVSPYAVKLRLNNLEDVGKTVGNLYAISTIGSIIGTFLSGYLLIPWFGISKLILSFSLVLVGTSIFAYPISIRKQKKEDIIILLIVIIVGVYDSFIKNEKHIRIETPYNSIEIVDLEDFKNKGPARILVMNRGFESGISLKTDDLIFDNLKYFRLAKYFKPELKKTLMLGGAGNSFTIDFVKKNKGSSIEVVEMDDKMTEIAKQYFNLKVDDHIKFYYQDARIFMNKNKKKYDAIYMDVFSSNRLIPGHLLTYENFININNSLEPEGTFLINIIANLKCDTYLSCIYKTLNAVFPQVYLFAVYNCGTISEWQNYILVASKNKIQLELNSDNDEFNSYFKTRVFFSPNNSSFILTDNFVPVEYLLNNCF